MTPWFHRLLLALCLVFAQIGGPVHAIGHLAGHHHDQGEPESPACELCLAYGHLAAGAPASAPAGAGPAPFVPAVMAPAPRPTPPSEPVYRSHAPPR